MTAFTDTIIRLLPWILPPLLGAIIGYVTNMVAIKMLFRPLHEKRVFGIRIPFTPGIIPKQRHQLADSIGNMVSRNLLTTEALRNHIANQAFRESLYLNISNLTEHILDSPVAILKSRKFAVVYDYIESFLSGALHSFFSSGKVGEGIASMTGDFVRSFTGRKFSAVTEKIDIKAITTAYLLPFLTGEKLRAWLLQEITEWTNNQLAKNTPLKDIIPADLVDAAVTSFRLFLPDLLASLFIWLRSEYTKKDLETQGRELLKEIFKKLNIFQQIVVSVAQYDKTLAEKMPEIIDDALNYIEEAAKDPVNQTHFIESSKKGMHRWLKQGVFDLFYSESIDINAKIRLVAENLFSILKSGKTEAFIASNITSFIDGQKDKTIKEILEKQLAVSEEDIVLAIQSFVTKTLTRPETAEVLSQVVVKLITSLLQSMEDRPLAEILDLDAETKAALDRFIFDNLIGLLDEKLPDLLSSLDIKTIVVNKIDALDVSEVEKLILMVIAKQLKWINVFGAILGALIGMIQIIFRFAG
ncbi:MAG: DUF445 family protein [Spirochaetales bacterium]|nr:DUF445 family protein [Spirochaetales bacterium]